MAQEDKKTPSQKRISEQQRMRYIGFDVFPGKPKDLFKNDSEKEKLVNDVKSRRDKGEIVREDCKLLEERISMGERLVLAVTSLIIIASLFLPWYSAYTEVPIEQQTTGNESTAILADSLADSLMTDSLMATDSLAEASAELLDSAQAVADQATTDAEAGSDVVTHTSGDAPSEEIITGHIARKSTKKEYSTLSGIGVFGSLGAVSSHVFSSGIVLMITGVLYLLYGLLCILLPLYTLYLVFGIKGKADEVALKIKKNLKYNWIPLIIYGVTMFIAFFGANYSPETLGVFDSIGNSYSIATFIGTLSWGVYISLAAFILLAVKGVEI